jgi:hypothetical protein
VCQNEGSINRPSGWQVWLQWQIRKRNKRINASERVLDKTLKSNFADMAKTESRRGKGHVKANLYLALAFLVCAHACFLTTCTYAGRTKFYHRIGDDRKEGTGKFGTTFWSSTRSYVKISSNTGLGMRVRDGAA